MWSEGEGDSNQEERAIGSTPLGNVTFHLEVDGLQARWGVRAVTLREAVGEPFRGIVEALEDEQGPEPGSMLGKRFALRMERGDEQRTVRGLIRQASAVEEVRGTHYVFHVVPSAWQLSLGYDTRTHRATTVPDLVRDVVQERLGRHVEVDTRLLAQTYDVHEMLVQYQESDWDFLSRWMEQEGIFWFFADGDDVEKLVLADAMDGLPRARPSHDGRVFHRGPMAIGATESVFDLAHAEELGPTAVTVREYDWTNPLLEIIAHKGDDRMLDTAPEVYDHTDAVSFHRYDGRQYGRHSAERAAQIRLEGLEVTRQRWSMHSDVLTAMPGHVLRVEGAPQSEMDGSYMIVRVEGGGVATEGEAGSWSNSIVAVPTSVMYRPSLSTPRPVVPGPETAIVVGPDGQDTYTDEHGRVKVHFHWDRVRGRRDADSSFWIRVAHNWSGPGFGTFFLPRIGMEVVVSFLGGNPDRPLITGCVYNGFNSSPANPLPNKQTQSVIRTRSSPNSEGYNEIRFEDAAGSEFVSLHAQRNLLENILNDHTTHVRHDQSNRVGGKQEVHVEGEYRHVHVDHEERYDVDENRQLAVGGMHEVAVRGEQWVEVDQNENYTVHGHRTVQIDRGLEETIVLGAERMVQSGGLRTTVVGGTRHLSVGDHTLEVQGNQTVDATGNRTLSVGGTNTETATGVFTIEGERVVLRANQKVVIDAPMGVDKIGGASNVESRDMFDFMAQQLSEIISAMKLSVVALSISETGIKIGQTGVAFSSTEFKIDRTVFKSELCDTVKIDAATLTVID